MISVMTDTGAPDRFRLTIRGNDVWLTKDEVKLIVSYLTTAINTPVNPVKPIKVWQLYEVKP